MTGNDLCHSHSMHFKVTVTNASHSNSLWFSGGTSPLKVLFSYVGYFTCVMSSVTANLCNKCPKQLVEQNSSYSDYFNGISSVTSTSRVPGGPVTLQINFIHVGFLLNYSIHEIQTS